MKRLLYLIPLLALTACGQISVTGGVKVTGGTSVTPPNRPVIFTFTANPGTIALGNSSTLSWTTSGCTSASIDNGVGAVGCNTTTSVSPGVTTTYTLTATNAAGNTTAQVTVTVSNSGTLLAQWNGSGALPSGYTVAAHASCGGGSSCSPCAIVNNGAATAAGQTMSTYNAEASALVCTETFNGPGAGGSTGPRLHIDLGPITCDQAITGVGSDCNPATSPRHFFVTWVENEMQSGITNGIQNSAFTGPQYKRLLARYPGSGQNQHEWFMYSFQKGDTYWSAKEDAGYDSTTGGTVRNNTNATLANWGGTWRVQAMSFDHDASAGSGAGCGYPNAYGDTTKTSPAKYWDYTVIAPTVTGPVAGCLTGMGYNPTNSQLEIQLGINYTNGVAATIEVWLTDIRVCTGPTETAAAAACGVTIP